MKGGRVEEKRFRISRTAFTPLEFSGKNDIQKRMSGARSDAATESGIDVTQQRPRVFIDPKVNRYVEPAVTGLLKPGDFLDRLAVPIAAWILFLQHQARAGVPVVDPFADRLTELALRGDAVEQILATREIFPESLASDPGFRQAVSSAAATTLAGGFASALAISP